jgi:hypothetical protein
MHPCRAASKGPPRTSVLGVLGVAGRRRAAGGEHRGRSRLISQARTGHFASAFPRAYERHADQAPDARFGRETEPLRASRPPMHCRCTLPGPTAMVAEHATAPFAMLATLRGRGSRAMTARRATALRRWFMGRVERRLLGQRGRSLARIPRNPLELVVTGRRRSGRPMAVSPSKPQGFAAGSRSPHTREVAGSNPAAPTEKPC